MKAVDLSFSYGKKKPLLFQGLSLDLKEGRIHGLLGANGAGKTTLLKILGGLLFPGSGHVTWKGKPVGQRSPEVLQDLFYLPEVVRLPPFTLREYVALWAPFYPYFSAQELEIVLAAWRIPMEASLHRLSQGDQKKFLLAFGLATRAGCLLLDEPTNALDIPSKAQLRRLLAGAAAEGRTILLSTHQARELDDLMDPVIILEKGRLCLNQDREELEYGYVCRTGPAAHPEALYADKFQGQWHSLCHRRAGEPPSPPDLEFLYHAVMAKPEVFAPEKEMTK